ncbi:lppP/LprE lipofamily protein [Mycobacterium kansasii]|uniref:LppP/LprE lipofamily protein n=1 Tax=Mycobacterium kansasii TaxID=1768 RepID=A0A1V3X7C7_MYCKA|nr:lppP/LprE lipofamily protein [Mycobacterium kansasii]
MWADSRVEQRLRRGRFISPTCTFWLQFAKRGSTGELSGGCRARTWHRAISTLTGPAGLRAVRRCRYDSTESAVGAGPVRARRLAGGGVPSCRSRRCAGHRGGRGVLGQAASRRRSFGGARHRPSNPPTTTSTAPAGPCGPDEATAVSAALAQLPADKKTGKAWNPTPEFSDYDPCADLSAVVVTVVDATRSSPDQALMFHRGAFVGTATAVAYPFTELEVPASTDDLVVLTYRSRQSCDACDDGTLTTVGFQWQGDHVQMLDPPPESLDSPP